ncbi:MAG: PfkB family carbohydrate kinase [Planctomycetota bacterium]
MSLVVVGSVAFDSIQTPEGRVDDALGGSAVHFSLAASLFTSVRLAGVVGEDFPKEHRELLKGRGIDLAGLETIPGGRTFRWAGEYSEDMNQRETLSVELNVFEDFQPRLPESYQVARYVFLANGAPITQASVLDQMKNRPFVMADTMDLWIRTAHHDLEALLRRIDGLVLNDQEALLLSSEKNLIRAGRAIREYGLRYLVIKKGEHGATIFHPGGEITLPALPLAEVHDPTGAGDSFAGGILGYLARSGKIDLEHFKRAVAWGTVCAAFGCQAFGVQGILDATREEVEARYAEYCEMLRLEVA